jgi:MFS family permease
LIARSRHRPPRVVRPAVSTSRATGIPVAPAADPDLIKNLRFSVGDAAFCSIMIGLGEQYLSAFSLALGCSDTVAGWIVTIPLLAGAALQLITPWAVRRLGSHRQWVVGCSFLQAAAFVPLMFAALVGSMPVWLLFTIASFYWGAGLAAGPAWNAWMTNIVPVEIRSNYLAKRTRIGQFMLLAAFLGGGELLQYGKTYGLELRVFLTLFALAGLCRFCSVLCLMAKSERQRPDRSLQAINVGELREMWKRGASGPLLAYLWIMYATAQIAGPFFTPYLLKDMGVSYREYTLVLGMSILAKVLVMPYAARFANKYGVRALLITSGVVLIPLPAMWLCSREIWFLLGVQIAAGLSWGAFELAIMLIFIETIPVERRTNVLTLYNLGYAFSSVLGSLLGGWLLAVYGTSTTGYFVVFVMSGIGRLCTLPLVTMLPGWRKAQEAEITLATNTAVESALGPPAVD